MKEYIVDVKSSVERAPYLKRIKYPIIKHKEHKFNISDSKTYPEGEKIGLDYAQMEAYKAALTQEFCLIQGPPGTGSKYS